MRRINDNQRFAIINPDDPDSILIITPLAETASVLIEVKSHYGSNSFTLTPPDIDFLTSLLNQSKRH